MNFFVKFFSNHLTISNVNSIKMFPNVIEQFILYYRFVVSKR